MISDIDGNSYGTVEIGNQSWMRQNLKTTNYSNGDAVPTGLNNGDWMDTSDGAYAVYNDEESNSELYGNLYNWYAASDSRGLCPEGWQMPTYENYLELIDYLDNSDAGGKLKSTGTFESGDGLWLDPNSGATNDSGFSGLPGGTKGGGSGNYGGNLNHQGHYWAGDSENDNEARALILSLIHI